MKFKTPKELSKENRPKNETMSVRITSEDLKYLEDESKRSGMSACGMASHAVKAYVEWLRDSH